jgi:hypothetical protein
MARGMEKVLVARADRRESEQNNNYLTSTEAEPEATTAAYNNLGVMALRIKNWPPVRRTRASCGQKKTVRRGRARRSPNTHINKKKNLPPLSRGRVGCFDPCCCGDS